MIWLLGSVQHWDGILPKGYKSSGLKSPASKHLVWDGTFRKRSNVTKELESTAVGYGASGEILIVLFTCKRATSR